MSKTGHDTCSKATTTAVKIQGIKTKTNGSFVMCFTLNCIQRSDMELQYFYVSGQLTVGNIHFTKADGEGWRSTCTSTKVYLATGRCK